MGEDPIIRRGLLGRVVEVQEPGAGAVHRIRLGGPWRMPRPPRPPVDAHHLVDMVWASGFRPDDTRSALDLLEAPGVSDAARAAAREIRTRLGAAAANGWIDRFGPHSWTVRDVVCLSRPFGLGRRRRARVEAAPALRSLLHNFDFARVDPLAYARGLRSPFSRWPAEEGRVRTVCAGTYRFGVGYELEAALALPPEWLPSRNDTPEGEAFALVAMIAAPLAGLMGSFDFLSGAKGRWEPYLENLLRRSGPGHRGDGSVNSLAIDRTIAAEGAVDVAAALGEQLVAPILARLGYGDLSLGAIGLGAKGNADRADRTATRIAGHILYGDKGLQAILDLSSLWHARLGGYRPDPDRGPWPVPFPNLVAPNGVRIVGLSDPEALAVEGASLDHCVGGGGYAGACRRGECTILSLRRQGPEGEAPLSTLELCPVGDSMAVRQHRGRGNGPPDPEAVAAVEWLNGALNKGDLLPDPAYLAYVRGVVRSGSRLPPLPLDDAALDERLARWAFLLPRHARDREGFARAVEMAVAQRILPLVKDSAASLPGGRFLAGSYKPILHPTPRWWDRALVACGATGRIAVALTVMIRTSPRRINALGDPGLRGRIARNAPATCGLPLALTGLAHPMAAPFVIPNLGPTGPLGAAVNLAALGAWFFVPWLVERLAWRRAGRPSAPREANRPR